MIRKFNLLLLITFFFAWNSSNLNAQNGSEVASSWNALLSEHVSSEGIVNYKNIKKDASFQNCITQFESSTPNNDWSRAELMSFWINAYNAFTVKLIVDNYPISSITNLKDPWDKKFVAINGTSYSLNQIEHELLRAKYKDPRIHFAVNCASYSCPKLHNRAFTPSNLEVNLENLTRAFVNDTKRNYISEKSISISKIFDWYGKDFTQNGTLIEFLNKYSATNICGTTKISYQDYNWNLNNK